MGTTVVTMEVSSTDSLVVSFTSESVRPMDLLEFIPSIALYHSSEDGSENSRVSNRETMWLNLLFSWEAWWRLLMAWEESADVYLLLSMSLAICPDIFRFT